MTLDFYHLREQPFAAPPDPRFLFLSSAHRHALASLLQSLQANRGIGTLLSEPGLGKTILLLHARKSFGERVATVYLARPPQTSDDLLRLILGDLGVRRIEETLPLMLSQLEKLLVEEHRLGKRVIVLIDDAHDLDASMFDLLNQLSTLQTERGHLVQVILGGQPSLNNKLAAIKAAQWLQRIEPLAQLELFSAVETAEYVDCRLRVAGYGKPLALFTPDAAALVSRFTGGNPRTINRLCSEILATAYRRRREQIGPDIVREVAGDLDLARPAQQNAFTVSRVETAASVTAEGGVLSARTGAAPQADVRIQESGVVSTASAVSFAALTSQVETAPRNDWVRKPAAAMLEPNPQRGPLAQVACESLNGERAREVQGTPEKDHLVPTAHQAVLVRRMLEELGEVSPGSLPAPTAVPMSEDAPEEAPLAARGDVSASTIIAENHATAASVELPHRNPGPTTLATRSQAAPSESQAHPGSSQASKAPTKRAGVDTSLTPPRFAASEDKELSRVTKERRSVAARQIRVSFTSCNRKQKLAKPIFPILLGPKEWKRSFTARTLFERRSLPTLTIAVSIVMAVAVAAFVFHRPKMSATTKAQTIAALPRLQASATLTQPGDSGGTASASRKRPLNATPGAAHTSNTVFTKETELKGMNLRAALRALSLRTRSKQRRQLRSLP